MRSETTYKVIHVGTAVKKGAVVVSPVCIVAGCAAIGAICTIVHFPGTVIDQAMGFGPIPGFDSPVGIRRIPSVNSQASSKLEESAVRNGVSQAVAGLEGLLLPANTTTTFAGVPARRVVLLVIVGALCKSEPGISRGAVWEFVFGGGHRGGGPLHLVVVTLFNRDV